MLEYAVLRLAYELFSSAVAATGGLLVLPTTICPLAMDVLWTL